MDTREQFFSISDEAVRCASRVMMDDELRPSGESGVVVHVMTANRTSSL